ncbi:MAG: glycosyl transferase family 1 [Rhodospirillaceae bacterium]|nr:MAG: glycosyl transferase family 1 [Rhodospirillaceae bacterium]
MRVLLVHNFYRHAGGEDAVFGHEGELLATHGHDVREFTIANDAIAGPLGAFRTALAVPYSVRARGHMARALAEHAPDLVHVHNFFPLLTPSIFDACRAARVASVMTLHNYRLICPAATLYRGGRICEECVTGSPYRAVLHGCYRGSRSGSLAVARMVARHRRRGTWATRPDRFIALTEFARRKFIEGGLPGAHIRVKANFLPDNRAAGEHVAARCGGLFVGRLSPEKGIGTLLDAWQGLDVPLRVIGEGPLLEEARRRKGPAVTVSGAVAKEDVAAAMARAAFLVLPSQWYEGFPMVLVEAFRAGLPVIASKLGAMAEIVEDGKTGLHFEPGDASDLAAKVRFAVANPDAMRAMGVNARKIYAENYTADVNYTRLMEIYDEARRVKRT